MRQSVPSVRALRSLRPALFGLSWTISEPPQAKGETEEQQVRHRMNRFLHLD